MFWWPFGKKRVDNLESEIKRAFTDVKSDFDGVGKWIKHLHGKDKQVFEHISDLKRQIATLKDDIYELKEAISASQLMHQNKQLSKKRFVSNRQTTDLNVYSSVQTDVQTVNLYQILQNFSSNERLLVYTLINTTNDMKLSYEDLARLLGKERSTIRGQVNAIKQKSEGLIQEIVEPNGKKRVFIGKDIKEKLSRYAKARKGNNNGKERETEDDLEDENE